MTPLRKDSTSGHWGDNLARIRLNPPGASFTLERRDRNGMIWFRVLTEDEDSPLTLREAAEVLQVDPATVHRLVAGGTLKAQKRAGVQVLRFRDVVRVATERGIQVNRPKGVFLRG